MKNIVVILMLISTLTVYSQNNIVLQHSKEGGVYSIDFLKYDYITDIYHNPGFTGVLEKQIIRNHYTSQWLNMEHFPNNFMASYDQTVGKDNKYGLGLIINRYQFNTKKLLTLDLAFSVKFKLNAHNTLRWGISAVSFNKNVQNTERIGRVYEDMIHTFRGPWYPTFERKVVYSENFLDFKTGVWLTHKKYFAGLSILHIAQIFYGNKDQPENSQPKDPEPQTVEFIINAGYELNMGKSVLCTPIIQIESKLKQPLNISPSINFTLNKTYIFGFTYHNMNVVALNIGGRLFEHINIIVTAGIPVKEELQTISKFGLFETGISYIF